MSVAPVLALLVCGVCLVDAVNLGQSCTNDVDCSNTVNSYCHKEFRECDLGTCKCSDGYKTKSLGATCESIKLVGQSCIPSTDVCESDTTCDGSTMQCSCANGTEHNTNIGKCVPTGEKEVGAPCTNNTGCYMGSSVSECVADPGKTDPKYCRCRAGYLMTTKKECRKPIYGEECTQGVDCDSSRYNPNDSSEVVLECTDYMYKCSCPATADNASVTLGGKTYNFCLKKYDGVLKDQNSSCTASNSCTSKLCMNCGQGGDSICGPGTGSGYETMRSTVGVLLGIVVLPFLNRLFF